MARFGRFVAVVAVGAAVCGGGLRAQAPKPSATKTSTGAAAAPADLEKALAGVRASAVRAHVAFLADDLLEGRLPGTRGYDLAAHYVASQLAAIGLTPAGDGDSFFQKVPLVESKLEEGAVAFKGASGGAAPPLVLREDFLMYGDVHRADSRVDAPVMFAGFGVSAPELKQDDYAGLDVKGKVVAVLTNAPASFPTEQRAHHANRRLKVEVAAERGAIAVLFIRTPDDEKRSPWARSKSIELTSAAWLQADGTPAGVPKSIEAAAILSPTGSRALFDAAGGTGRLDAIFAEAAESAPKGFALDVHAVLSNRSTLERISSPNVVGALEGSDAALKKTSVAYSGHLDHVGIGAEVKGDKIYNGAYDNAMGTSILIEAARALASLPTRPKRSLLFVFVTAEEKGLVGSDYFATKPSVPRGSIVANVNVDMPLLMYPLDRVVAFGAENSSLEPLAARGAQMAGLTLVPDPMPEENLFVRSDQYSFVRQGIPAVFLVPGLVSSDKSVDGAALFREFLGTHYHQPSDDLSRPVNGDAVERFTRANVAIGYLIAQESSAPAWKPNNFFGKTFGGTR